MDSSSSGAEYGGWRPHTRSLSKRAEACVVTRDDDGDSSDGRTSEAGAIKSTERGTKTRPSSTTSRPETLQVRETLASTVTHARPQ